jgi:cleavage and polyadenylation specificity factor subunit 3
VTSVNELLKKRVETVLDMALTTITSLAQTFTSSRPISHEDSSKGRKETANVDPDAPRDSSTPQNSPQVGRPSSVAIDEVAPPVKVHGVDKQPEGGADDQADDTDESDDGEEILQVHD